MSRNNIDTPYLLQRLVRWARTIFSVVRHLYLELVELNCAVMEHQMPIQISDNEQVQLKRHTIVSISSTHSETLKWRSELSSGDFEGRATLIPICGPVIIRELESSVAAHRRCNMERRALWSVVQKYRKRGISRCTKQTGGRRDLYSEWEWPLGEPEDQPMVRRSTRRRIVIVGQEDSTNESDDSSSDDEEDEMSDDDASVTSMQIEDHATRKLQQRDRYFARKRAWEERQAEIRKNTEVDVGRMSVDRHATNSSNENFPLRVQS